MSHVNESDCATECANFWLVGSAATRCRVGRPQKTRKKLAATEKRFEVYCRPITQNTTRQKEWILRGALTLHDLPEMTLFPINPFTDLGADIAEVWSMHWSVDLLACMGVSLLNMRQRGLSAQLMQHFQIPLSGWLKLRLNEKDIQNMSDDEIDFVFQIDRHEILDIIKSHTLCQREQ